MTLNRLTFHQGARFQLLSIERAACSTGTSSASRGSTKGEGSLEVPIGQQYNADGSLLQQHRHWIDLHLASADGLWVALKVADVPDLPA